MVKKGRKTCAYIVYSVGPEAGSQKGFTGYELLKGEINNAGLQKKTCGNIQC